MTLLNSGSSLLGGIRKNADKLGTLAGFLTGSPGGLVDVQSSLENLFSGNVHIPNMQSLASWAREPHFKSALMLYIGGEIIDVLNIPKIGPWGKAMKAGAIGYATGSFFNKLLWSATHADQGSDPTKPGVNLQTQLIMPEVMMIQ